MTEEGAGVELVKLVHEFFDMDGEKASAWFLTKNHNLGAVSPIDMIISGRIEKLLEWVREQVSLNEEQTNENK